jgi:hypothetical protein
MTHHRSFFQRCVETTADDAEQLRNKAQDFILLAIPHANHGATWGKIL